MRVLKEFKEFAFKGSVIDLAIGIIIGAAFGRIINSVVDDVMMPMINPLIPAGGWQNLVFYPGVKVGNFMAVTLNFLIVVFVLFIFIKALNAFRRKEQAIHPPPISTTDQLLMEIRDTLKKDKSTQL